VGFGCKPAALRNAVFLPAEIFIDEFLHTSALTAAQKTVVTGLVRHGAERKSSGAGMTVNDAALFECAEHAVHRHRIHLAAQTTMELRRLDRSFALLKFAENQTTRSGVLESSG
jgi:hypothetical protein